MKLQTEAAYKRFKTDTKTRLRALPVLSQDLAVRKAYDVAKLYYGNSRLGQFWHLLAANIAVIEPLYKGVK